MVEIDSGPRLHIEQASEHNFHRLVGSWCDALIWYSGKTATNGRGSLMAYYSIPSDQQSRITTTRWLASLSADAGWRPDRLKQISAHEIDFLKTAGRSPIDSKLEDHLLGAMNAAARTVTPEDWENRRAHLIAMNRWGPDRKIARA